MGCQLFFIAGLIFLTKNRISLINFDDYFKLIFVNLMAFRMIIHFLFRKINLLQHMEKVSPIVIQFSVFDAKHSPHLLRNGFQEIDLVVGLRQIWLKSWHHLDSFFFRKGHPFSPEVDLKCEVLFSLQERKLMFSLKDIQHKCYIVLKMINRDIINLDCITSYHWKTCLFCVIEEVNMAIWTKNVFIIV